MLLRTTSNSSTGSRVTPSSFGRLENKLNVRLQLFGEAGTTSAPSDEERDAVKAALAGGKFVRGTNDIAKGLARIDEEIRSRYTLAYQSTDANFDGGFRKLKIEVRRPDTQVIARAGYLLPVLTISAGSDAAVQNEDQFAAIWTKLARIDA